MFIYLISNTISNTHYIGQTTRTVTTRYRQHISALRSNRHTNERLQRSFNKHGESAFTCVSLATARHILELNELERIYIETYNTLSPHGYNLRSGGGNDIASDETRKKMSAAATGRVGYWNGKVASDETKLKVSEGLQGNANRKGKRNKKRTDIPSWRPRESIQDGHRKGLRSPL